jgi:hypothetical protein
MPPLKKWMQFSAFDHSANEGGYYLESGKGDAAITFRTSPSGSAIVMAIDSAWTSKPGNRNYSYMTGSLPLVFSKLRVLVSVRLRRAAGRTPEPNEVLSREILEV